MVKGFVGIKKILEELFDFKMTQEQNNSHPAGHTPSTKQSNNRKIHIS